MISKVLVVEDEFVVANDLRLILAQAGYKVIGIAGSYEEAYELIQNEKPDLVLLDIQLKGKLSGIDLARMLSAENIAFIYLSANSNQKILEEAKTTQPYGFLVKPFREKDLLVTIDIASYRHKHSLESKLRREEHLQKQLTDISNEASDTLQKLLKSTRTIQSYIPFDLLSLGVRPVEGERLNDKGYMRTGFDEYQFIGEKELTTIAGLNKKTISLIIQNSSADNNLRIYNSAEINKRSDNPSLQILMSRHFRMNSFLMFPIALGYGISVHYCFYSRQPDIYTKDHLALLNRLKMCLVELGEKIIHDETSSLGSKKQLVQRKRGEGANDGGFKSIIGNHHLLLSALDLAAQVAPYNTSVLILGDSGTGKEKVAQFIHDHSTRSSGPFIKVNCAAIPATLVESELFGHEKGAFTGAIEKRKGKFEQADGGTIFLDEIGEVPTSIQVKLLRVLQEREIEALGGNSPLKVNVRIVAATNRNLDKEVAQGKFRLDLYYRLNVFPIFLPPLKERKTDIESLAIFFARKFCTAFNKPFIGISESMMEEMFAYDWPGNIRELENIIEQSVVLSTLNSKLQLMRPLRSSTPLSSSQMYTPTLESAKRVHRETEKEYIISTLKKTNGRIRGANGAAELLNIKPTTLESKIAKLNISKQDFINTIGND